MGKTTKNEQLHAELIDSLTIKEKTMADLIKELYGEFDTSLVYKNNPLLEMVKRQNDISK